MQRIIASLHAEFAMTDLGPLNYILCISATRTTTGIFLSQTKYATEILERVQMLNCNPCRTPINTEKNLDLKDHRSLILLYIAALLEHFGTIDLGLQLFRSTTTQLIAYSDADWAGCPATRRSTFGYCVFLGDNLLMWSSKRQDTLSRSSAKAEYRRVANAIAETSWFRNLLRELHTPLFTATLVYCDNVSAVYMSANPVQHQRTKHIDIDIHFVRDKVAAGHKGVPSVKAPNDPNADDNMPGMVSPSDPIVQSVNINTKSTSYAGAAGASAKDQPKVNSNFRPLVADPVFDGVNISISRKVVEKKWSMDTRLLKEELTRILIWVKLHDVPIQVFEDDGISLIATFIGKPVMLDSYTSSMCSTSLYWEISPKKPSVLEIRIEAAPVEKTNDGFNNGGEKKKKRKEIQSNKWCPFMLVPSVKQTVRYEPKATTNTPNNGDTNKEEGEEEDEEEEVENGYDETTNLFTKTGGSSSRLLLVSLFFLIYFTGETLYPKRKLMVTDDMVDYVLEKYGKNWKFNDQIADVILEDLHIKYGKYDKGKGKFEGDLARANQEEQAGDDVDLVDADDVDHFENLDLQNKVTKLKEDFTRMLKAKKAKEAKEP
ncbi:ribonuclease H-like domain-containing protein [Tanacetum coccineum]